MKLSVSLDQKEMEKAILAYLKTQGMFGKSVMFNRIDEDRGMGHYFSATVSEVETEEPKR